MAQRPVRFTHPTEYARGPEMMQQSILEPRRGAINHRAGVPRWPEEKLSDPSAALARWWS
jgi:hypothetical protein